VIIDDYFFGLIFEDLYLNLLVLAVEMDNLGH
jgi:hypothetical protein